MLFVKIYFKYLSRMLKEWVLEQFVTGVNSVSSRTLRSKSKKNGDSVIKNVN